MIRLAIALTAVAAIVACGVAVQRAEAQDVGLQAPHTPSSKAPGGPATTGNARESEYPGVPQVPYTAGFVSPLSVQTSTGTAGIAGWTAPNPSVGTEGTGRREASGVFGLGFAVEWGRAKSPTVSGQKPTAASSPGAPPALPSGPVRQADAQR